MPTPLDMPIRRVAAPTVRLAYRTSTGTARRDAAILAERGPASTVPWGDAYEPYCFVCGRCTDHLGEHNDIPEGDIIEDYATGVIFYRPRTPWRFTD